MLKKNKIYCYVDESGQDTNGELFIVVAAIFQKDREKFETKLRQIENISDKKRKWSKSNQKRNILYIKKIARDKEFIETIFYSVETNKSRNKSYLDITISTIASAIDLSKYQSTKAVILIDGLQKSQVRLVSTRLRRVGLSIEKVRGVKKDENNIFIRLVDSFAGFIRENVQNDQHEDLLKKLTEKRIITNIKQSKNPRT